MHVESALAEQQNKTTNENESADIHREIKTRSCVPLDLGVRAAAEVVVGVQRRVWFLFCFGWCVLGW